MHGAVAAENVATLASVTKIANAAKTLLMLVSKHNFERGRT